MTIGEKLKELRERSGMTQFQLAVAAGSQPNTIAQIEGGRRSEVLFATIVRLSHALGVSTQVFADCDQDAPTKPSRGPGRPARKKAGKTLF